VQSNNPSGLLFGVVGEWLGPSLHNIACLQSTAVQPQLSSDDVTERCTGPTICAPFIYAIVTL